MRAGRRGQFLRSDIGAYQRFEAEGKATSSTYLQAARSVHWLGVMSLLLATLTICSLAFPEEKTSRRQGEEGVGKKSIEQVLRDHTPELISIPGVVGTAEGRHRGAPCVEVYVVKKTWDLRKRIPTSLDGYPVIVRLTGEIRTIPEKPVEPSAEK